MMACTAADLAVLQGAGSCGRRAAGAVVWETVFKLREVHALMATRHRLHLRSMTVEAGNCSLAGCKVYIASLPHRVLILMATVMSSKQRHTASVFSQAPTSLRHACPVWLACKCWQTNFQCSNPRVTHQSSHQGLLKDGIEHCSQYCCHLPDPPVRSACSMRWPPAGTRMQPLVTAAQGLPSRIQEAHS
jgi:hypothetical protein